MIPGCHPELAGTDRLYRYRPSPNRQYTMGRPSPTPGSQMMYSYGNLPPQGQQHPQSLQHMSRPSPPQPTWEVSQTHPSYYDMPRGSGVGGREDSGHLLARTDATTSQPLALSSAAYSNSMAATHSLATTDYFPGVIDTSKLFCMSVRARDANQHRSLGSETLRGVRVVSFAGFRRDGLQSWNDGP
jgi:hypothetical protein